MLGNVNQKKKIEKGGERSGFFFFVLSLRDRLLESTVERTAKQTEGDVTVLFCWLGGVQRCHDRPQQKKMLRMLFRGGGKSLYKPKITSDIF